MLNTRLRIAGGTKQTADEIRYYEKLERPERVIKVTAVVPNSI